MPRPKQQSDRVNPWRLFVGAMVPNWLLERPELSLGSKLVYGRLAQYAGRRGYAYPLMKTLGRALGISERQARRYMSELKKHKLVYAIDYPEANLPSRYYFLSHRWMYDDEVPETTPQSNGDRDQEENDLEFQNGSEGLADPPDGCGRTPRTDVTPTPGQMCPPEESQGRDSEKENQSGAERHPGSTFHSSGRSSPGAAPVRHARDLCAQGLSSGDVPKEPSLEGLKGAEAEAKAKAAEVEAKARLKASKKKRAGRRIWEGHQQEQKLANLNGKKLTPEQRRELKGCEGLWLAAMRKQWPDATFVKWAGRERGQCINLLQKYPSELVEQAISYVIVQWDTIRDRMFKGKGTFPSVGMLLRVHEVLVPESQQFAKALAVHKEYEDWCDANPHKMAVPRELTERYEAVKPDLKALGIVD